MLLEAELVEQRLLHPRPLAQHPHRPPASSNAESGHADYRKVEFLK